MNCGEVNIQAANQIAREDVTTMDDGIPLEQRTTAELLAGARSLFDELGGLLCTRLSANDVSPIAKVPYKARVLREVLLHRTWELGDSAYTQYENGRVIPAFTLTRAAFETACVLFDLHRRVKAAVNSDALGDLDEEFLMKALFGRRDDPKVPYHSLNVLTVVDHVDKYVAGGRKEREGVLRRHFDNMCEFVHPNWAGAMGAYCHDIDERHSEFGPGRGKVPSQVGLYCLRIAVNIAGGSADGLAELEERFRKLCERELPGSGATKQ